jgi:hypothetical protein
MNVKLYTTQTPVGNAVLLAKVISKASGVDATQAMQCTKGLFQGLYDFDNALILNLKDEGTAELSDAYAKFGVCIHETQDASSKHQGNT